MGNGANNEGMGQLMGEWATNRKMGRKRNGTNNGGI